MGSAMILGTLGNISEALKYPIKLQNNQSFILHASQVYDISLPLGQTLLFLNFNNAHAEESSQLPGLIRK